MKAGLGKSYILNTFALYLLSSFDKQTLRNKKPTTDHFDA